MKCSGSPNFAASAIRMPPLAVPSSLAIMRPVSGTTPLKASTWPMAFCPVVASSTSSVACGALGSSLRRTRTIFSSSAISPALFCKRPAVSIKRTSAPEARAFSSASKARPAASAPVLPATTSVPVRRPQTWSCSMAAARNVSPAASTTFAPLRGQPLGDLADGGGLAGAVDAGDQDDEGLVAAVDHQRLFDGLEDASGSRPPGSRAGRSR